MAQRIIKFRIWDREQKKMFDPNSLEDDLDEASFKFGCYYEEDFMWSCWARPDAFPKKPRILISNYETGELMQFTGLTDKNEKEIYESDILKIEGKSITKVWYSAPSWLLADYTTGELAGSFDMADWGHGVVVDEFEVIGNAHENPELLKK